MALADLDFLERNLTKVETRDLRLPLVCFFRRGSGEDATPI